MKSVVKGDGWTTDRDVFPRRVKRDAEPSFDCPLLSTALGMLASCTSGVSSEISDRSCERDPDVSMIPLVRDASGPTFLTIVIDAVEKVSCMSLKCRLIESEHVGGHI